MRETPVSTRAERLDIGGRHVAVGGEQAMHARARHQLVRERRR